MLQEMFGQWLVLFFYLSSFSQVEAQFPIACTTPEALGNKTCCPLWNGSPCGESSGRGECVLHTARASEPIDYRVNWPHAFYDSVCKCFGNYDGFDCGVCLPGWKGDNCRERHHVAKKEITDMTENERETFLSNLDQAKHTTSNRYKILTSTDTTVFSNFKFHSSTVYDLYVWMHYYASKKYADTNDDAAHRGPAFPFWHRVFMLFIEREIRLLTGNQDFYIPYWNWTRHPDCNICTNKYFGAVDQGGHIDKASRFSKWRTACVGDEHEHQICSRSDDTSPAPISRKPGMDERYKTLPTHHDVIYTLETGNYDTSPHNKDSKNSFRSKLEGFEIPQDSRHLNSSMHNLVHDYLNGTMSHLPTAANDPMFMVHHSFVDKLLEDWLQNHSNARYPKSDEIHPAQKKDAFMAPFFPLRSNGWYWAQDTRSLGYSYLELRGPQPDGGGTGRGGSQRRWLGPVLGVSGVALPCGGVWAARKYKGKRRGRFSIWGWRYAWEGSQSWAKDTRSLGYSYLALRGLQPGRGGSLGWWLGPVLGVSGVALPCGGVWAARKYKGKRRGRFSIWGW